MPEISIITPVYQAEKFLKKCVDSILSQSFTDWELLLVDDGSTDKSSEICRTYAEQDARIRYCLLYTSQRPRDGLLAHMPSTA